MLDLEGVNAKIGRAHAGVRSLEADVAAFCEFQRRQIVFDESQPQLRIMEDGPAVPVHYSIRVGEIAYNLRSALDHLIWQLVKASGQCPNTRNEFPIFKYESKYKRSSNRKLRGLDENQRKLVDEFQPYRDCGGVGKQLLMLHEICNIDKHRYLNVVATHSFVDLTREPVAPIVDVCFMDEELERISPGYESPIEQLGMQRPPVVSVLSSCLAAVNFVVAQFATQGRRLEYGWC